MKVCAFIAEYNPLHLGHIKHLKYMKETLKAEKLICIMSGNFTQRGEASVLNKYERAKQAINAGADIVIELPTVFAISNAEIFAKGAISILNKLGVVDTLCFGVESGKKEDYLALAKELNNESKEFKKLLKTYLESGVSFAKAKFLAVKSLTNENFDENLINSPNNILGIEYTRALLKCNSNIEICPMLRLGDHNDNTYKKGITSASSIRNMLKLGKIKKVKSSVPKFVYKALKPYPFAFDKLIMASILTSSQVEIASVYDCTEGLENRIKALSKDNLNLEDFIEKVSTKRYTQARVRRILLANFLGVNKELVDNALSADLYAKVLAISNVSKDLISTINGKSSIPLLTRKSDCENLRKTAKLCFEKDVLANDIYTLATGEKTNEYQTLFV